MRAEAEEVRAERAGGHGGKYGPRPRVAAKRRKNAQRILRQLLVVAECRWAMLVWRWPSISSPALSIRRTLHCSMRCARPELDARLTLPADLSAAHPGDVVLGRLDVTPTLEGVEPGMWELRRAKAARDSRPQRARSAARGARQAHDGDPALGRRRSPSPDGARGRPLPSAHAHAAFRGEAAIR